MRKDIKKPIKNGIAKVPVVMQLEMLECGAASLAMVLAYYDKWIPLEKLRAICGVSRNGANAKNILTGAKFYGLETEAYKYEVDDIVKMATFPCIIHWNFNHFVVLDGFKNGRAYINDPARGVCSLPLEQFDEAFTGICLQFSPNEDFEPSGSKRSIFGFISKRLKGELSSILFVTFTSLIIGFITLFDPIFLRFYMDKIIDNINLEWGIYFILIVLLFAIMRIIVMSFQDIYHLRINGKLTTTSDASFMWKILRMPIDFFSQRNAGDLQNRQSSNSVISNTFIVILAPLLFNTFMLIFYLIVMFRYSVYLSCIGLLSIAIDTLLAYYATKKRINHSRIMINDLSKLYATTVSGIELIETIKSSGAENGFFEKWAGYQAGVNNQEVKLRETNIKYKALLLFIEEATNIFVMCVGVWAIIRGDATIGGVMAFHGFMTAFMTPSMTFVQSNQMLQEMCVDMERIDDVMEYPLDDTFVEDNNITNIEYKKLSGKIEIKNVVFGYSPIDEPVIKNFSLSIESGKSVAIVGRSGCGKSTISKLVTGLYKPWSGDILFDGKTLKEINKNIFKSSVAIVDQDIMLFEDTIANNIKFWDDSIEQFDLTLAARDAGIYDDIMERQDGFEGKIYENGRNFSGGQRQRIEIARALAQDPTIIILDEATSALDTKTEFDVVKSIKARGISCIVIAHRLSTIRSCDEIIVLDHGEIKARGTHEELLMTSNIYKDLVIFE